MWSWLVDCLNSCPVESCYHVLLYPLTTENAKIGYTSVVQLYATFRRSHRIPHFFFLSVFHFIRDYRTVFCVVCLAVSQILILKNRSSSSSLWYAYSPAFWGVPLQSYPDDAILALSESVSYTRPFSLPYLEVYRRLTRMRRQPCIRYFVWPDTLNPESIYC